MEDSICLGQLGSSLGLPKPEDGCITLPQNVCNYLPIDTS